MCSLNSVGLGYTKNNLYKKFLGRLTFSRKNVSIKHFSVVRLKTFFMTTENDAKKLILWNRNVSDSIVREVAFVPFWRKRQVLSKFVFHKIFANSATSPPFFGSLAMFKILISIIFSSFMILITSKKKKKLRIH